MEMYWLEENYSQKKRNFTNISDLWSSNWTTIMKLQSIVLVSSLEKLRGQIFFSFLTRPYWRVYCTATQERHQRCQLPWVSRMWGMWSAAWHASASTRPSPSLLQFSRNSNSRIIFLLEVFIELFIHNRRSSSSGNSSIPLSLKFSLKTQTWNPPETFIHSLSRVLETLPCLLQILIQSLNPSLAAEGKSSTSDKSLYLFRMAHLHDGMTETHMRSGTSTGEKKPVSLTRRLLWMTNETLWGRTSGYKSMKETRHALIRHNSYGEGESQPSSVAVPHKITPAQEPGGTL